MLLKVGVIVLNEGTDGFSFKIQHAWQKAGEPPAPSFQDRISIVDGVPGLRAVLSDGAITDITGQERQCRDWNDWGLVQSVFGIINTDLAGQNRRLSMRDTKSLPKGFSYETVSRYYMAERPPV